ncbi:MAG: hypothetical protein CSH49_13610 [Alcanivorax sp.]|nr:MAG: hypothetical protein CSH49_13610 [Alcanivorax sp.]
MSTVTAAPAALALLSLTFPVLPRGTGLAIFTPGQDLHILTHLHPGRFQLQLLQAGGNQQYGAVFKDQPVKGLYRLRSQFKGVTCFHMQDIFRV